MSTDDRATALIPANPGALLVGCGVVGEVHANALAELAQRGQAHLAGVVDSDPARAERFGQQWDVPWTTALEEALRWPEVRIAHICTPSGLHAATGIQAARAGKHLLVEKPIDVTLEAADRLIGACRAAGVSIGVVSQHRFDPGFRELRVAIREGRLGTLLLGEARVKWYRSQAYYQSAAWRGTRALDGGGALINQSIHYVDLLLALCGPVERVSAYTATAAHDIEVEDVAAAVLRFRNGATGTILGSTAIFPGLSERLEISGTNGTAIVEDGELVYLATQDIVGAAGTHGRPWQDSARATRAAHAPHAPPYGGRHTDQIADFVDALRHGRPPEVTAADGRAALALVLAVYRAAATHREVPIDDAVASM
ncbi:MAG TPA: Gfo/Idh/MocA family oxidoreductase [Chloroflexota bacterium]|jgi:predicted dehydrogenase|nr:Gfo/Idh/MocA family oxidoreductase [Chloroflexota bacterium]